MLSACVVEYIRRYVTSFGIECLKREHQHNGRSSRLIQLSQLIVITIELFDLNIKAIVEAII